MQQTETTIGKISATLRQKTGKSANNKLHAQGLIPAICYGHREQPLKLTVDPTKLRRSLDPQKKQNTLLTLSIDDAGKTQDVQVLLKAYQLDSLSHELLHADFIRVSLNEEVQVQVPLELTGKPEGVTLGGILHQVFRNLPVKCLPDRIPVKLTADVSALKMNDALHVQALSVPEGVRIDLPLNQTLALVMAPKQEKVTTEAETAAAEGEAAAAPAEGAAAAPATAEKKTGEKKEEKPAKEAGKGKEK